MEHCAVLRLRAIAASQDREAYWQFHLAQGQPCNRAEHYEDAQMPDVMPPRHARVRTVK